MQTRLLAQLAQRFITVSKKIQSRLSECAPSADAKDAIQNMSNVLVAQIKYVEQELKDIIPIYLFLESNRELNEFLMKLDGDFIAWENAIQAYKVKALDDFLNVADPITDSMGKNLEALIEKRKEHINQKINNLAELKLNEILKALTLMIREIEALIKKLPVPNDKFPETYNQVWKIFNTMHANAIEDLQKNIAPLAALQQDIVFLNEVCRDQLDATIMKYTLTTQRFTTSYNELTELENAQLQNYSEQKQIQELKQEREAQFALLPKLASLVKKPSTEDPLTNLAQVVEHEKTSPSVSPLHTGSEKHTPPSELGMLEKERSSSDEEATPVLSTPLPRKSSSSSKLSTSAAVSSMLPRVPVVAASESKQKGASHSPFANQQPAAVVPAPAKQNKGILGKLGWSDKSAPQHQKSTTSAAPVVHQGNRI